MNHPPCIHKNNMYLLQCQKMHVPCKKSQTAQITLPPLPLALISSCKDFNPASSCDIMTTFAPVPWFIHQPRLSMRGLSWQSCVFTRLLLERKRFFLRGSEKRELWAVNTLPCELSAKIPPYSLHRACYENQSSCIKTHLT